ncbi:hypothetical protein AAHE18_19G236800 [Arachis hypogaea]
MAFCSRGSSMDPTARYPPSPPSPHSSSFLCRYSILLCDCHCHRHPLLLLPSCFISSPTFSFSLLCGIERESLVPTTPPIRTGNSLSRILFWKIPKQNPF